MDKALRRKSQLAWGVFTICAPFLLETWNAHRLMPNPASPYVWSALGLVAAGALVCALRFGARARAAAAQHAQ
jgi:hypothetical protein